VLTEAESAQLAVSLTGLTPLGVALKNLNPSDSQQIRWGIGLGFFDSYHFVKPDEYCEYDSVMFNKYDDGRAQSL